MRDCSWDDFDTNGYLLLHKDSWYQNTFIAFIGGQYFTFTFYNMAVLFDNEF